MLPPISNAIFYISIGAAIGLVLVFVAPKLCQKFHRFSISRRALPLHILSAVGFAFSGMVGLLNHNYMVAVSGLGMSVLSTLVTIGIANRREKAAGPGDGKDFISAN